MTFKPARLLLALIALVSAPAFAQNAAVVNGKPISSARLDATVKALVAQGQGQGADPAQMRETVKRDLIAQEVLAQEAARQGYDKKPEVKAAVEEARVRLLTQEFALNYLQKNAPTDAELQAGFTELKSAVGDKEYKLRLLAFASEMQAKEAIAKLKTGTKVEDVAKTSLQPTLDPELQWTPPTAIGRVALELSKLPKGGVYDNPLPYQNVFLAAKVEDTRPLTLDSVKPDLQRQVAMSKFAKYRDQLVKSAKVQ